MVSNRITTEFAPYVWKKGQELLWMFLAFFFTAAAQMIAVTDFEQMVTFEAWANWLVALAVACAKPAVVFVWNNGGRQVAGQLFSMFLSVTTLIGKILH